MKDFNCITCDDRVTAEPDMVLHMVLKDSGRFWACSQSCAETARDDSSL